MAQHERLRGVTGDQWNEMADIYQSLTIGTGEKPITVMLERANSLLPFAEATAILDNGCGPGSVMKRLLEDYTIPQSCQLACADFSDGMIARVRERKSESIEGNGASPWQRVETLVQDATNLDKIEASSKSHLTAGWVYFMTSDPTKCLSESRRVLKDGGVLACSSWQETQWGDIMNLFVKVRPDKEAMTIPEAWRDSEALKAELDKAGFRRVECHQVHTLLNFKTVDSFVDFMADKMPHMKMLTNDMSNDDMEQFKTLVKEELRKLCPTEPGALHGTALVALGQK